MNLFGSDSDEAPNKRRYVHFFYLLRKNFQEINEIILFFLSFQTYIPVFKNIFSLHAVQKKKNKKREKPPPKNKGPKKRQAEDEQKKNLDPAYRKKKPTPEEENFKPAGPEILRGIFIKLMTFGKHNISS